MERFKHKEVNTGEQAERWRSLLAQVEGLKDRLGKGVDEGIKETIAAFWAHGLHTTASCEGHLDWGTKAPWVDVHGLGMVELERQAYALLKQGQKEECDKLVPAIVKGNLAERRKLMVLLSEFYAARNVPFDQRLVVQSMQLMWSRVESQGADMQDIEDDEAVIRDRLRRYQEEMNAFTEFLKGQYLREPSPNAES